MPNFEEIRLDWDIGPNKYVFSRFDVCCAPNHPKVDELKLEETATNFVENLDFNLGPMKVKHTLYSDDIWCARSYTS